MAQPFGVNLPALTYREYAAVGVAPWGPLARIIPDPLLEESAAGQKVAARHLREHKALRDEVQRILKGTAKGKNVEKYAEYIAQGLKGERGKKWSTPPLCLWSSEPLAEDPDNPHMRVLPMTSHVVAIDAETQVCALHRISENPERFGVTPRQIDELQIPFEMYWDISATDAKQIFHDRNWYGVPVAKTLALSMDQFDLATLLAQQLMTDIDVTVNGQTHRLSEYVNTTKRQLSTGANRTEWITLSGLRSLVVTALLGRPGIVATANAVAESDLPEGVTIEQAGKEVIDVLGSVFERLTSQFAANTAITTPACLAGIGVAAHRVMSWSDGDQPRLTRHEFLELLGQVVWERKTEVWDGIAGRRTTTGEITFGGGAKDSGGKVADAILYPATDAGRQIRGKAKTTQPA